MQRISAVTRGNPKATALVVFSFVIFITLAGLSGFIAHEKSQVKKDNEEITELKNETNTSPPQNVNITGAVKNLTKEINEMERGLRAQIQYLGNELKTLMRNMEESQASSGALGWPEGAGTILHEKAKTANPDNPFRFGQTGYYTAAAPAEATQHINTFWRPICNHRRCHWFVNRYTLGSHGNTDRLDSRKSCLFPIEAPTDANPIFCTQGQFSDSIAACSNADNFMVLGFHGNLGTWNSQTGPTGTVTKFSATGERICIFKMPPENYQRYTNEGKGICHEGECAFAMHSNAIGTYKVIFMIFSEEDCTWQRNIVPDDDDCPGKEEDECQMFWADIGYWGCVARPRGRHQPKIITCSGNLHEATCKGRMLRETETMMPQGQDPNAPHVANDACLDNSAPPQTVTVDVLAVKNPEGDGYVLLLSTPHRSNQFATASPGVASTTLFRREGMELRICTDENSDGVPEACFRRTVVAPGGTGQMPNGVDEWQRTGYVHILYDGAKICVGGQIGNGLSQVNTNTGTTTNGWLVCESDVPNFVTALPGQVSYL